MSVLPNGYRAILLALSVASFLPQFRRILSRQDCTGLSPIYLLFNLIAATQPFTLSLHLVVNHRDYDDSLIQSPPTLGNWLNLAQLAAVWACQVIT